MEEETQEKQAVTDADLDAALADLEGTSEETAPEEVQEEVQEQVEEEVVEEEVDDDGLPTDHAARTRLGQKMSAYFKKADRLEEMMGRLVDLQEQAHRPQQVREFDPDETVTYRDLDNYYEVRREREAQADKQYQDNYLKTVYGLDAKMEDTAREEIFNEMYENFNNRYSDDAAADARINWAEAKAAVYQKRLSRPKEKKNPLKGEKPRSPLGGVDQQSNAATEAPLPKLSGAAAELLADTERRFGADKAKELHKKMSDA